MKIIHLLDDPALGGINRLLADQLPHLSAWDHEKVVLPTKFRIAPALDADVVIVHFTISWAKLPFLASLRRRFAGKPIILVEHSYTARYEACCVRKAGRFRRMLRLAYSLCDGVIAVSHAQGEWLVESGLAPSVKVAVVPPALDLSCLRLLPLPKRHAGPLRLVAYGRYAPQKGFETLIAAVRQLPVELVTLTFAGYGPLEEVLRELADGAPNIEIGGPIKDPTRLLAGANAVVIPSRWEAYGLVAAEARMAARPIVASRVDGLIQQVDGDNGVLVPPDDPDSLAQAILGLRNADLAAMGAAARHSVVGEWPRHLMVWRRLFARLSVPNTEFPTTWRRWQEDVAATLAREAISAELEPLRIAS